MSWVGGRQLKKQDLGALTSDLPLLALKALILWFLFKAVFWSQAGSCCNIKGASSVSPFKLSSMVRVVTQFSPLCREGSGRLFVRFFKRPVLPGGADEGCYGTIDILHSSLSLCVPSHCGHSTSTRIIQKVWWKLPHTQSTIPRPFFGWLLIMNNDIFLFSFPLKLYSETSNKRSFCNWFGVGPKKLFIYFKILSDK